MKFPCIQCGLCCENANLVPELQQLINENGQCCYYDKRIKKCRNYAHRPEICRTDVMYENIFSKIMNEKDYVLANLKVCYKLNQAAGYKENAEKINQIMKRL